jgi:hypothetical protein
VNITALVCEFADLGTLQAVALPLWGR